MNYNLNNFNNNIRRAIRYGIKMVKLSGYYTTNTFNCKIFTDDFKNNEDACRIFTASLKGKLGPQGVKLSHGLGIDADKALTYAESIARSLR